MNQELTLASKFLGICALLTFVGVLAAVGEQDFQDAQAAEKHSCQMVSEGLWPSVYTENFNCNTQLSQNN